MMTRAVLDACVLYPATLRDFMLWLAYDDVFFPLWSEEIRNEWIRNLLQKRPELKDKLERTRRVMNLHFPDSLVYGHESIMSKLQLPDSKDLHVLAAAIHAKAKYIITFDLAHFPNTILQNYNIEAVSPDEFVSLLIPIASPIIIDVARDNRLSLTCPPKTVDQYLATLERQRLPKTVAFLREHRDRIG
jgi:predicted nucleic acid-binding protein